MKKLLISFWTVITAFLIMAFPVFAVNMTATAHVENIGWSATRF